MVFTPSNEIKVSVLPEQREWVGTPEMIGRAVQREDTVAFDIWDENQLVGFVHFRRANGFCGSTSSTARCSAVATGARPLER